MIKQNICPYCSAPIQENASFCLHCMKSLDNKLIIKKEKSKKSLLMLYVSIIFIIIILCLSFFIFLNKNKNNYSYNYKDASLTTNDNGVEVNSDNSNINTDKNTNTNINADINTSNKSITYANDNSIDNNIKSPNNNNDLTSSHTHNYVSKITISATCSEAGELQYICTCGDTYTEKIAATENHKWTTISETVHHAETGHYENIEKTKQVVKYQCEICKSKFDTLDAYYFHFDNTHTPSYQGDPITILRSEYWVRNEYESYYDKVWIVDNEAYDEQVITGYKCSVCGKTK